MSIDQTSKTDQLALTMCMALADSLGVTPKQFAVSFRKNAKSLKYLKDFTAECLELEIEELKKNEPIKSPLNL